MPQADEQARPTAVKTGDIIRLDTGMEVGVRAVSVVLHLENGADMVYGDDESVTIVYPEPAEPDEG